MLIEEMDAPQAQAWLPSLVELLQDAVNDGASIGFLSPLSSQEAKAYWYKIIEQLATGNRVLLVALEADQLIGTVQLEFATKANASHRLEVQKLLVHTRFRRQGLGRKLLQAVDAAALKAGRTLLVLDTRRGDPSEKLYRSYGYNEAGIIPRYVHTADGVLEDTVLFYRELELPAKISS